LTEPREEGEIKSGIERVQLYDRNNAVAQYLAMFHRILGGKA